LDTDDYLRAYVAHPRSSPDALKGLDGREVQVRWTTHRRGGLFTSADSIRYVLSLTSEGVTYISTEDALAALNAGYRKDQAILFTLLALYTVLVLASPAHDVEFVWWRASS